MKITSAFTSNWFNAFFNMQQAFGNRLKTVFEEMKKPISLNESFNTIQLLLKKSFFIKTDDLPVGFNGPGPTPLDGAPNGIDPASIGK